MKATRLTTAAPSLILVAALALTACSENESDQGEQTTEAPTTTAPATDPVEDVAEDVVEEEPVFEDTPELETDEDGEVVSYLAGSWLDVELDDVEIPEEAIDYWGSEEAVRDGIQQALTFRLFLTTNRDLWSSDQAKSFPDDFISLEQFYTPEGWTELGEYVADEALAALTALTPADYTGAGELGTPSGEMLTYDLDDPATPELEGVAVSTAVNADYYGDDEPRLLVHTPHTVRVNGSFGDESGWLDIDFSESWVALVPYGDSWGIDTHGGLWEVEDSQGGSSR